MSGFSLKQNLKEFFEVFLVLSQFIIILLHFIKFELFVELGKQQTNFLFEIIGYFIIVISLIVMSIAITELGSNLSPFPRPKEKTKLITSGIYRFIRHPMYYSLILISFGVFLTKLTFYYLFLTITLIFIIKSKIVIEDHYLNKKFSNYFLYKEKIKY